jgi:threonine dehydrogenase-like Zn-dependent dehydrogenase
MDVSDDRLQFCAARLPLARATRIDSVADLQDHEPPTAIFDATGNAASMTRAFEIVPSAGRLIFVGLVRENLTFNDPEFHRRELTVFASRNATAEDFRQVMTWIETARLNASALVTHRVPFDRLIDEFPSLLEQGGRVFKTLVEFPDHS